ncbi:response regulator [Paenibacillus kobensis]|uniref:response regulator n=1 Tax=Paenibacillus kobensis TaxID=59841 RepID=UPI000FD7DDD4|nr:response regulator [Paenibacillus kobensis]
MKLTIGTKLLTAFLLVSLFVAVAGGVFYYYMNKVNDSYSNLIDQQVSVLAATKDIQILVLQQTNDLRGYLLTDDASFLTSLQSSNNLLNKRVAETELLVTHPDTQTLVQELARLNQQFQQQSHRMLDDYETFRNQENTLDFFKSEVLPIGKQLSPLAASISDRQEQLIGEGIVHNEKVVNWANSTTRLIGLIAFILTLSLGFFISRQITGNLNRVTNVISSVKTGYNASEGLPRIEIRSKDEIGAIALSFNEMATTLDKYSAFERDKTWLETTIAELVTMVQGVHDLNSLAQLFITKITPLTGASLGVFYIRSSAGGRMHLTKLASYAASSSGTVKNSFQFGEGLVGQAAADNRAIILTAVPESYIPIRSGTGEALPASIIIMPVQFEGQVAAVIELAAFTPFTPIQMELLNQVLNHLGITIHSIAGRMQIEQLLQESQALTEELQCQSEELQLQQEELRGINEKLEEQYRNSEQKTKELELTKLQLEEKASQLALNSQYKSEFLANMSHELRTPLNSLLILSDILSNNTEGNLTAAQIKYAHTIHQSGNDLLRLINDILDLSKVESGMIELYPDEVQLRSICELAEQQFSPVADKKGLSFRTELDAGLPPMLYTDEQRLMQIVKNLLSNAFKFTSHGQVKLRIQQATSSMLEQASRTAPLLSAIAFSISDTGIGIASDKQNLIFQAFQQADGTTNRKYGGTGLGLSISREMARLLSGSIIVESVEGRGSTFTLLLPDTDFRTQEQALPLLVDTAAAAYDVTKPDELPLIESYPSDLPIKKEPSDMSGRTVLIVDDDMRNIFAITSALESRQMNVLFAENGREGIASLQQHPAIDLVLMDIMLPELDGYDTMRTIRSMPQYASLPIIALTAKAMKDDRDKCIEAGASDYISKPIGLEQLFAILQHWMCR